MAFTEITVTGSFEKPDGTAASGTVSFQLSSPLKDSSADLIIAPFLVTETLDASGEFSTVLIATNDATTEPTGATYIVTEEISGARYGATLTDKGMIHRKYAVEIPFDAAAATIDLADLAPVENATLTYGVTRSLLEMDVIVVTGELAVVENALPSGARIFHASTLNSVYARVGTAPDGSAVAVGINRNGTEITTVTIADAATSGSTTGLSVALAADDIITFDITGVGSTTPGDDLAIALVGS